MKITSHYRQSFLLLLIKVFDTIVALLSIFYVAASFEPEVYALKGIKAVYDSVMILVPNLGFETILIRNYLHWNNEKNTTKSNFYFSLALESRFLVSVLTFAALIMLSLYYWVYKYKMMPFPLFVLVLISISSVINGFCDSLSLSIIATGRFLFVRAAHLIFFSVYTLILMILLPVIGPWNYLILLQVPPFVTTLSYMMYIKKKKLYRFTFTKPGIIIKELRKSKNFIVENLLRFASQSLDSLIVSMFISPAIFASYSIAKTLEFTARSFLDQFFDPLAQRMVSMKSNPLQLHKYYSRVSRIRYLFVVSLGLFLLMFVVFGRNLLQVVGLDRYLYLTIFGSFAFLNSVIYALFKTEMGVISLLYPSRFRIPVALAGMLPIFTYSFWLRLPSQYSFIARTLILATQFCVITYLFRRKGGINYSQVIDSDV